MVQQSILGPQIISRRKRSTKHETHHNITYLYSPAITAKIDICPCWLTEEEPWTCCKCKCSYLAGDVDFEACAECGHVVCDNCL